MSQPMGQTTDQTTPRTPILPALRARLFGTPDPVARQLREIARQGASLARLAHLAALALILLFSAASLVALSGDALLRVESAWHASGTIDIPAAVSTAVSALLVVCMDLGMVYAASVLRILSSRHAEARETRPHLAILLAVAAIEGGTYAYMAYAYDHPATWTAWALISARALAAPALSVYLSMARPLPVGPRDILYQVELASGAGVIRDAVTAARDGAAPLDAKVALYRAAALMSPRDRARLDNLLDALRVNQPPPPESMTKPRMTTVTGGPALVLMPTRVPPRKPVAPSPRRTPADARALRERRVRAAARALVADPDITDQALARAIALESRGACGATLARELRADPEVTRRIAERGGEIAPTMAPVGRARAI